MALLLCLLLLCGTKTTSLMAARRGDRPQVRVLQFFRTGLALSACSYLLRTLGPSRGNPYTFLSFVFCFAGTLIIWIGWMEHSSLRRARTARQGEEGEDGGAVGADFPEGTGLPRLNAQARRVLRRAQEEAQGRRQRCVDTDHLLLGLLKEPSSAGVDILGRGHPRAWTSSGVDILGRLNVQVGDIQMALGLLSASARRLPSPSPLVRIPGTAELLPLTDRAREALLLAAQEAHRFDRAFIGTDHLLLGLVLMGRGAAAATLFREGVTVEGVRSEVLKTRARG